FRRRDQSTAHETTAETSGLRSRNDVREKGFHTDSEGKLRHKRLADRTSRSRLLGDSGTWLVVAKNRAGAPRFVRPAEKSRSPPSEENSKESASNRPRSTRLIFLAALSALWPAMLAWPRRGRAIVCFVQLWVEQ